MLVLVESPSDITPPVEIVPTNLQGETKETEEDKCVDDRMEFIIELIDEAISESIKGSQGATEVEEVIEYLTESETAGEVETNYQCGECGKTYETLELSENHIVTEHKDRDCPKCATDNDKDDTINKLKERNEYIIIKNVQLEKEIKRMNYKPQMNPT